LLHIRWFSTRESRLTLPLADALQEGGSMPVSLVHLAAQLQAEIHPPGGGHDQPCPIDDVATIEDAGPAHLTYVDRERHLQRLSGCSAGAVLVQRDHVNKARHLFPGAILAVADAREAFIAAMLAFRPPAVQQRCGVSSRAVVARSARVGKSSNIHPLAFVGENVQIGERCDIHPGVVIGEGCTIGDGVVIYPNAVLYAGVRIGARVIIHAGSVIGADGFGYRFEAGAFVKIPHTGTVIVEEDVEIGAGSTIDRGMVGATVIGAGTKIDNQVMIAHNCRIGRHNAFASQVGFAGSSVTEDYVRCAGQAGIADHLRLGQGSTIGPQAGVHLDVPAGAKWHGAPAGPDKEQIRVHLCLQRLPELMKQFQQLAEKVASLSPGARDDAAGRAA
jgi:UDP-3-O-[3-hydroxymyristoyl] glucosamine N-acyltransferase